MKGDRNRSASERLNAKTLDQMFVNMVEQGYEIRMSTVRIQRHIRDSEIGIHTRTEQSERDECGAVEGSGNCRIRTVIFQIKVGHFNIPLFIR